jgi:hypothetical protein
MRIFQHVWQSPTACRDLTIRCGHHRYTSCGVEPEDGRQSVSLRNKNSTKARGGQWRLKREASSPANRTNLTVQFSQINRGLDSASGGISIPI